MKVAVIYPYFPHYRMPILNMLKEETTIDYYFLGGTKASPEFNNLKLIDFPDGDRFLEIRTLWFFKYFSIQPNLLSTLKNQNFDALIIYGDWKFLSTWRTILHFRFKKVPVLFWSHGFRKNKRSINDFIKNIYFNLFNGGFVFDHRAKEVFKEKKYQKEIDVVFNSLDYEKQLKLYQNLPKKNNNRFAKLESYVVFSGRLTASKRLEVLFQAISQLKNKGIIINVLLVGEGIFKPQLETSAKNLNITEQVIFYGSCYDESIIGEAYDQAIVSVIPSAVGLSAIHALTFGCPVITDDNDIKHGPEIEAVIQNYSGKYYKHDSIDELADEIEYFYSLSDSERNFYRKNSLDIVKTKFNPTVQKRIFNSRIFQELNIN